MGCLTIKRQKQSGKGLQGFLKVTIDETQILEISNGETKKIELYQFDFKAGIERFELPK